MKNKIKLIMAIAILTPCLLCGQGNSTNKVTISENASRDMMSVSVSKLNILYLGIDNPVEIAICDVKSESISATIDNGTITKVSGINWIVKLYNGNNAVIKIYVEKDGKKTLYGERIFKVRRMQEPVPVLAGVKKGTIDKKTILDNPNLTVEFGDFLLEDFLINGDKMVITSFSFTSVDSTKKEVESYVSNNNALTINMINSIKRLNPGDKFYIENITLKEPDGSTRKISAMTLAIK